MNGMVDAAKTRAVVRLADGRTGRLIYWPIAPEHRDHNGRTPRGGQALILLPSGAYINAVVDDVTLEPQDAA